MRECTQHLNNDCSVGSVFKSHNSSPQNKPSSSTGWLILLFFCTVFFFFAPGEEVQIIQPIYNHSNHKLTLKPVIKSTFLSCGLIVHIAHKLENAVCLLHSIQKDML